MLTPPAWAQQAPEQPPPAAAKSAEPQPAETAPAGPPDLTRVASFNLGPSAFHPFDRETRDELGAVLYGGEITLKFHPIPWLSTSFAVGYLAGYQKRGETIGYARYTRVTTTALAPTTLGLCAELLPRAIVNPYLGVGGGATYLALREEPQDVRSPIPLRHDELVANAHQWLGTVEARAGFDVRLSEWAGLFVEGYGRWLPGVRTRVTIPDARSEQDLRLTHAGATIGVTAYY
jgi:hypothetical protein